MTFLQNCWYAAAFSEEIDGAPLARTLLDTPVVIYRTETRGLVALRDRCPHRFAPLHMGKVFGDDIRCPYHGLRFGPTGQCVDNPIGEGQIPRAAQVTSYPVHEVDGVVWMWFGDQPADTSKVVRFEQFDQPDWATFGELIEMQASSTLVADNLLDLCHAEFLHPDLVSEGYARRSKMGVTQEGDAVVATNFRPHEPLAKAQRLMFGDAAPDYIDRTAVVTWFPAAIVRIDFADAPAGNAEGALKSVNAHLITPETETSCHYFFKVARDYQIDNEELTAGMRALTMKAFTTEDKPMIEAQQRNMGGHSFDDLKPVLLPSDSAAARARLVLGRLMAAQTTRSSAGADDGSAPNRAASDLLSSVV